MEQKPDPTAHRSGNAWEIMSAQMRFVLAVGPDSEAVRRWLFLCSGR